jgi:alcohol dehydrogenase class IV
LSGQAINIARTTAAHAASYPLTSRFGITHGHAVGLVLSPLFELNAAVTESSLQDERGLAFVQAIMRELLDVLGVESAREAKTMFLQLLQRVHLSHHLSDLGVTRDQLETIAQSGISSARATNNPRRIERKDLQSLYEAIF